MRHAPTRRVGRRRFRWRRVGWRRVGWRCVDWRRFDWRRFDWRRVRWRRVGWRRPVVALAAVAALNACVTLEVPLVPDDAYPKDWGPIGVLGVQCAAIEGRYWNMGTVSGGGIVARPDALASVLEVPGVASTVALALVGRGTDRERGTLVALRVTRDDNAGTARLREGCACTRQTLVCPPTGTAPGAMPVPGVGAPRNNLLISIAVDGALIAKIQGFRVSTMLGSPVFDVTRTWARFERAAP